MARWLVQTFDSRIRPGYDGGEVGKVLVLLIQWRFRLKVWLDAARRRLGDWLRVILARVEQTPQPSFPLRTEPLPVLKSYEKLILTDGVSQTLFKGYAQHRESARGEDETGWILMGHRHEDHGLALAAIPAGVNCEAGVAHVRFNSQAQSVASMILRQDDRKLNMLGVVHTHPGSLRHPSRGDLHGDREWIGYLRGQEGVFGIGTADGEETQDGLVLSQPSPSTQCYLGLRYSWYCLGRGDRNYRALPVQLTIGPDLAEPLHKVWSAIESHAKAIERLYRTLKRIRFQVETEAAGNALLIRIPFDEDKEIRVALSAKEPSYLVCLSEQWLTCDPGESAVDQCVFSILEKLAQL
jgi:proteasome lid subunit RPN8/RPN11